MCLVGLNLSSFVRCVQKKINHNQAQHECMYFTLIDGRCEINASHKYQTPALMSNARPVCVCRLGYSTLIDNNLRARGAFAVDFCGGGAMCRVCDTLCDVARGAHSRPS